MPATPRTYTYGLAVAYSPTDRLMLDGRAALRHDPVLGERPHPTEVDDGHEHSTLTDLRVSLHYQWLERPVALAPYVHSSRRSRTTRRWVMRRPGRGLNETWVGFGIGKNLDDWLPRTYVQGRVNYAFVEEVADVAHDRSNYDLEIGYFITPQWSVRRARASGRSRTAGWTCRCPRAIRCIRTTTSWPRRVTRNVGSAPRLPRRRSCRMYATYLTSIRGRNGHKLDQSVTVGISYGFALLR